MGQPRRSERGGLNPETCPVTAAMAVIAGKWAGMVWWRLSDGPRTAAELLESIPGVSRKMIAEQLRVFEEQGIAVATAPMPGDGVQTPYSLTEHGRRLAAVWKAIAEWGEEHLEREGAAAEALAASR